MASVNKVILVGNLGRDPEVRFMPNGEAVCNFSIATTDSWKDKSGAKQERTEWHNIVMYRKLAEIAGEYLKKGRPGQGITPDKCDFIPLAHDEVEVVQHCRAVDLL